MDTTKTIALIITFLIGTILLGYLITTGICAVIIWLFNSVFETTFNPNIWAFSGLVYLVIFILQQIFKK